MIKQKNVILYHGGCGDGFGAAWAAWKKFGKQADYIGVEHKEPPPKGLKGKNIFIVDFSYPRDEIEVLLHESNSLTILDHHVSAKERIKMADEHVYDVNHSGAVLAWRYFHPKKKIPRLLAHVEDIDIWRFKLPKTREIVAYINSFPFDFLFWNKLARELETKKGRGRIVREGEAILRYQDQVVERAVESAELVKFSGRTILAVNSTSLRSEIGNALVKKKPPMAIVWWEERGTIRASLRSNNSVDVSEIATRFGGGGHKKAAAFSFPATKHLPWKPVKK